MTGDQGMSPGWQDPNAGQHWTPPMGGQGPYPPPGPFGYGQYPQGPPPKSRTGLIIGLVVGGVVLLVGAVVAVGAVALNLGSSGKGKVTLSQGSGSPQPTASSDSAAPTSAPTSPSAVNTFKLPSSVAGYHKETGNVADRIVSQMRAQMTKDPATAAAYGKARFAIYTNGGTRLVVVGLAAADDPLIAAGLRSTSPSGEVDQMMVGAGIGNTSDYPAGPLGGVLRCGKGTTLTMCGWADSSVGVGVISNVPASRLARITLSIRAASEKPPGA
jgi:hypothetical protein